jgi:flagellar basal-body rod protein FlgB
VPGLARRVASETHAARRTRATRLNHKVRTSLAFYNIQVIQTGRTMDPVNIFAVASQHNRWLSIRQSAVAQNIANANTPGYKAVDVEPFEAALDSTRLAMTKTRAAHLTPSGSSAADGETVEEASWEIVHSGNSVNYEQQLMKSGEIGGAYARNTGVMKAFHRMLMASARG